MKFTTQHGYEMEIAPNGTLVAFTAAGSQMPFSPADAIRTAVGLVLAAGLAAEESDFELEVEELLATPDELFKGVEPRVLAALYRAKK